MLSWVKALWRKKNEPRFWTYLVYFDGTQFLFPDMGFLRNGLPCVTGVWTLVEKGDKVSIAREIDRGLYASKRILPNKPAERLCVAPGFRSWDDMYGKVVVIGLFVMDGKQTIVSYGSPALEYKESIEETSADGIAQVLCGLLPELEYTLREEIDRNWGDYV